MQAPRQAVRQPRPPDMMHLGPRPYIVKTRSCTVSSWHQVSRHAKFRGFGSFYGLGLVSESCFPHKMPSGSPKDRASRRTSSLLGLRFFWPKHKAFGKKAGFRSLNLLFANREIRLPRKNAEFDNYAPRVRCPTRQSRISRCV